MLSILKTFIGIPAGRQENKKPPTRVKLTIAKAEDQQIRDGPWRLKICFYSDTFLLC
jgi:hypothetical protein